NPSEETPSNSIDIDNSPLARVKRNGNIRGKGQTQSQYLHFGNSQDGKAEAEATQHSSRAVVVGSNGMGQAQSQSLGGDCSTCYGSVDGGGSYVYGMRGNIKERLVKNANGVIFLLDSRPDPLKVSVDKLRLPEAYDTGSNGHSMRPGSLEQVEPGWTLMGDQWEASMHKEDLLVEVVREGQALEVMDVLHKEDLDLMYTVDQVVDQVWEVPMQVDMVGQQGDLEQMDWMFMVDLSEGLDRVWMHMEDQLGFQELEVPVLTHMEDLSVDRELVDPELMPMVGLLVVQELVGLVLMPTEDQLEDQERVDLVLTHMADQLVDLDQEDQV
uniref:Uncharacterized protein n=1 Tax=Anopheles culicifacies TaxID=139723 RepID=A0A182LWJ6_9DIPT